MRDVVDEADEARQGGYMAEEKRERGVRGKTLVVRAALSRATPQIELDRSNLTIGNVSFVKFGGLEAVEVAQVWRSWRGRGGRGICGFGLLGSCAAAGRARQAAPPPGSGGRSPQSSRRSSASRPTSRRLRGLGPGRRCGAGSGW